MYEIESTKQYHFLVELHTSLFSSSNNEFQKLNIRPSMPLLRKHRENRVGYSSKEHRAEHVFNWRLVLTFIITIFVTI